MQYRPEIDGLRAVAVLFVIFYHLNALTLGVGFAGVDVFFVISGYLIGGQIISEKMAGVFSFGNFYARRARRILPALFVTILVSMAVGWTLMLPEDYRYFLGGAATALLSISNYWFAARIDYFNPLAADDPLVHTWTLGVEEQFYLLVPLLIVLVLRFLRPHLFTVLLALSIASFALAVWLSHTAPQLSYYILPTRAWELLAGVLIAMKENELRAFVGDRLQSVLANAALFVLIFGVITIPSDANWPGMFTLVPVLSTAAFLAFGSGRALSTSLLSFGPMKAVGLVSYSAYLVHQPILGFLSYREMAPSTIGAKALVFAATFILAYASWRFIEIPFRKQKMRPFVGRGLLGGAALLIFLIAVGGHVSKGYPMRMPQEVEAILAIEQTYGKSYKQCLGVRKNVPTMDLSQSCILGPDETPKVALWGDSHAAVIFDALSDELSNEGLSTQAYLVSSCQPIPALFNAGQKRTDQCAAFNARVLVRILEDPDLEVVVLVATWDNYFLAESTPDMFGRRGNDDFYAYPIDATPNMPESERRAGVQAAVSQMLKSLVAARKKVVIVNSVPRPDVNIPRYAAFQVWNGKGFPTDLSYNRSIFDAQTEVAATLFKEVSIEFGPSDIAVVQPGTAFCDQANCKVIDETDILFTDGNHLSVVGAQRVAPLIATTAVNLLKSADE
ncbi:MAG: acyltransferase family protein [Paracoccaceae bacterium]